jgi:hypothetical protein
VRAVLAEFDRLPEAQKQEFASQGSRSDPSTIDVRRHRARRRLLGVVEAFGAVLGWIVARGRATRPALLLTSSAAALSVVFVTGVGLPSWSTPTPSSPTVTASVTATRSTGRPPARSAAAAAPRAARKALAPEHHWSVAPPIRPVVSQPTPGHGDLSAGIEEGGDRAPLSCVRLKVSPTPFCVDYPARP